MDTYGVIGYPIKHSLSPAMHNAAFKKLGIEAEYKKFEVRPEGLEDFLTHRKDVKGFNITVPHKVRAKEILEKKFPTDDKSVQLSGAINTVKRIGEKIEYYNTDVSGFRHSLESDLGFKTKGKTVLIIGCGGAGRAVITALVNPGCYIKKVYVYDVNEKAVDSIKKHFSDRKIEAVSKDKISEKIAKCQLLVNASSVGMKEGDGSIIDKGLLRKDLYVYDLVYNRTTQLVEDARAKEAPAENGRGMLAVQGAISFSLWIDGVKPIEVVGVMREELDKALERT